MVFILTILDIMTQDMVKILQQLRIIESIMVLTHYLQVYLVNLKFQNGMIIKENP